ncbi:SEC14-like protein 1 isoform X1 [Clavelina lepadiformis]|uniref:SEC14-like protein 1 isoform X1 n=1 Tax=Clavelina lepadiformis TaxID=159417 RepID=UPI0040426469
MVQQYQSPIRVYKHPFEMVMAAYEKRFPTCDMIPVFIGCEILNEHESEDKSTHVIERRCKLNVDAPRLLKRMVGFDYVYFVQKNSLNRKERTLNISAYNESFSSRVLVNECCQYTVHPDNPNWTCFEQTAKMEIKSFFGFESSVEKIAMKQYAANIKKGKEIIEHFLGELLKEGITHIPTWAEQNPHLNSSSNRTSLHSTSSSNDATFSQTRSRNSSFSSTCAEVATTSGDRIVGGKEDKLDEEYIEHNLGILQPLEESKLIQLRKWLSDTHNGKIPRDEHILRFLRSRDFNMEKAREVLCQSLSWRKQHQIDRILDTWSSNDILTNYYLGGWHHHDLEGRPVYVLKLGKMDTKGLLKAVGQEGILRHVLYIMEEGLKKCREVSLERSKPTSEKETHISSWTCIVDLDGLNMRHLWRPGVQALLRLMEVIEANYPETMARLLIVRSPRVFPVLWALISPFIDEKTSTKFMMYTGTDYLGPGGLVDYIPAEFIPDFLGGSCQCNIADGEVVPKSMYRLDCEKGDGVSLWEETIYKTANVFKGAPHEVVVEVPDKDCVITWDFDSLKGDVMYTLFYSKKPMGPLEYEDLQCIVPGPSTAMGGNQVQTQNVQVIDKHMILGKDYSLVESSIVCREGESVQGSHVARHGGFYILQWKFHAPPAQTSSVVTDVIYQVTHNPKAKVIYYHEVLPSENFRGSMTSLESCQSAFSTLSHVTGSSITS